ncbi:MAG: AAA domain-containing protein [Actinomycetota bacterium]|nr:AAA domain-containing protein [Actinomycetota bacterium]
MLYDETQKLLLMYFLLEYWKNEYIKSVIDRKQRLEGSYADALDNPLVIAGLTFVGEIERFGKNERKLKDGVVFEFPFQQIDRSKYEKDVNYLDEFSKLNSLTVDDLNFDQRTITFVKKDTLEFNQVLLVTPDDWVPKRGQEKRFFELVEDIVEGRKGNEVAISLLAGETPNYQTILRETESSNSLGAITEAVSALDNSYLAIQGPPGTGKTWTGARLITHLISKGKRVGITAQSWAAIDNLLRKTVVFSDTQDKNNVRAARLFSKEVPQDRIQSNSVEYLKNTTGKLFNDHNLVASSTWFFAKEGFNDQSNFDYLVIDEAGQLSLADALAVSSSARNIILLGDPQQLPQVNLASHQAGSGSSVLEHVLGGDATINDDYGFLLGTTYRLAPDICGFISQEFYDNKLGFDETCTLRSLESEGTGLRWVPVQHEGECINDSKEEAESILKIVQHHLGKPIVTVDEETKERKVRVVVPSDFKIVAPYNAQKFLIRQMLVNASIDGVSWDEANEMVGTVDKFQGQEAPIVIYSLTTSNQDLIPTGRGDFIFSPNRLNVAISRAQCLAYLVGSEDLINTRAKSIEEMSSLNHFCRYVDEASEEWQPK